MTSKMVSISDSALKLIIDGYTKEAGVRTLERVIIKVLRKCAVKFADGFEGKISVTPENLEEFLRPNISEKELETRKYLLDRTTDPKERAEYENAFMVADIRNNKYTPKQRAVLGVIHRDRNKALLQESIDKRARERAAVQNDPIYEKYGKHTGFLPSDGRVYQDAVESLKEEEFKEKVLPLVVGLGLFLVVVVMIKIFIRKIDFKEEN